jgi:hypothetical protein
VVRTIRFILYFFGFYPAVLNKQPACKYIPSGMVKLAVGLGNESGTERRDREVVKIFPLEIISESATRAEFAGQCLSQTDR